jgi:hypothetical protein
MIMNRLIHAALIHYDARGTRVLLRRLAPELTIGSERADPAAAQGRAPA